MSIGSAIADKKCYPFKNSHSFFVKNFLNGLCRYMQPGRAVPDSDGTAVKKPVEFEFVPVEENVSIFMDLIPPDSASAAQVRSKLSQQTAELRKLFDIYLAKMSEQEPCEYLKWSEQNRGTIQEKALFLIPKLKKVHWQLRNALECVYSDACTKVQQLMVFTQTTDCAVSVRIDDFVKYVEDNLHSEEIQKLEWKRDALLTCLNSRKLPRIPIVPPEQIAAAIKESTKQIDPITNFSPYGFCDDMLYLWIAFSQRFEEFDKMAKAIMMNKSSKLIDFSCLKTTIIEIMKELESKDQKQQTVVHIALMRIFFDRYYLLYPETMNKPDPPEFTANCVRVRNATPSQIFIDKKFMQPEMMEQTFVEIVAESEHLQEALELLGNVCFFTNFYDIVYCVFQAIKCIEKFVRRNGLVNEYGKDAEDGMNVRTASNDMAFDDLLPIFCGVFSVKPPLASIGLANTMVVSYGMDMSVPFNFAKMFFTSAVDIIERNVDQLFCQAT